MSKFAVNGILFLVSALAFPSTPAETYSLQARRLIDQQQFQAALSLLDRVRHDEPKDLDILYLRGYVLYRLHHLESARIQLEEVNQSNPSALRACYFLGKIAILQGHPEDAVSWLTKPASANPPIEDSPAQLSKALLDAHQLQAAKEWTEKALELTPWEGSLHYRLARIYQQLGRNAIAEKEFQASIVLKVADRDAVEKLVSASRQIARGDISEARKTRDSFLEQQKLDPDALVALGSTFASAGLPQDAVPLFRAGADRDPSSFQAHFDLALALLNMQMTAEAIAPLEASLKIAPGSVDCNAALGVSYVMLGNFHDALPKLEIVHSIQPDNVRTEGLLALAYLRTGAAGKAIPLIRTSLVKRSDDPKLYFLLIECLNSIEEQVESLATAEQAAQRFPSLAKAHLAKAQQLARLGRYEEAGPSFAKASELAPGDLEPLLGLAEVQNKSGTYSDSLANYQRALLLEPKNLTAELGSAKDLIALGKISEARDLLRQAAVDHKDNLQIHFELSRVYMREGSRDEAAKETAIVQRLRAQAQESNGQLR